MSGKGYIKLYRQIQDCWIWIDEDEPERFTRGSAWVDLLLFANHKDKKIKYDNGFRIIKRGQYLTSKRKLAERWMWNRRTVDKFLDLLVKDEMITIECTTKHTLITIVNYEIYQGDDTSDAPQSTPQSTPQSAPRSSTNNKLNNIDISNDISIIYSQKKDCEEIVALFNSICTSFSQVKKMSDKRLKTLKTRLKTYTKDDFKLIFEKAEASDFLSGRNGSWSGCGFDWLITESNMIKVMEGNYDNKGNARQVQGKAIAEYKVMNIDGVSEEEKDKPPRYGLPEEFFKGDTLYSPYIYPVKDLTTGKVYSEDDLVDLYYERRDRKYVNEGDLEFRCSN